MENKLAFGANSSYMNGNLCKINRNLGKSLVAAFSFLCSKSITNETISNLDGGNTNVGHLWNTTHSKNRKRNEHTKFYY